MLQKHFRNHDKVHRNEQVERQVCMQLFLDLQVTLPPHDVFSDNSSFRKKQRRRFKIS